MSPDSPSRVEGNLGNGPIGVAEQRRSPLDAPREQVAMRRHAEGLLEGAREMGFGDSAHSCEARCTGQSSCEAASIRSFARSRRRNSSGSWHSESTLTMEELAIPSLDSVRLHSGEFVARWVSEMETSTAWKTECRLGDDSTGLLDERLSRFD